MQEATKIVKTETGNYLKSDILKWTFLDKNNAFKNFTIMHLEKTPSFSFVFSEKLNIGKKN